MRGCSRAKLVRDPSNATTSPSMTNRSLACSSSASAISGNATVTSRPLRE